MRGLGRLLFLVTGIACLGQTNYAQEAKFSYSGDGTLTDFAIEGEGTKFQLFIATKDTNAPLKGAQIELVPDDEAVKPIKFAESSQPGVYLFEHPEALPEGNIVVSGPLADDIEVYQSELGSRHDNHSGHDHGGAKSGLPKFSAAMTLGFAGVFFVGFVLGRILSRSRMAPKVALAIVVMSGLWQTPKGFANEGHAHGEMSVDTRGGEYGIFVSKKSQFLLGLRTQAAVMSVPEQSIQTIGHAGAAPMYDATIKSPATGEFRPARQLQIGSKVAKNEVLGWVDSIGSVAIKSPISGNIVSLDIFAGLRTETGNALMRVTDTKTLWIDAEVFQQDLLKIREARSVSANIDGRTISGKIVSFQTNVSEQTLSGKVFVEIENKENNITLGSAATVSFITGKSGSEGFVLPRSAVLFRGAESIVFVQTGPEIFEQKIVTFEPAATPDILIVRTGLDPGDRVVVSGNYQLLTAAR